jgi:hypothetical protein
MIITLLKNEEIVKVYKIGESIFEEGFRILVDTPKYNKKNASIVAENGKDERIFATREQAAEFVFSVIDKHMKVGVVDKYEVEYR